MDEFIKRISERLADQPSRRGFFSTMGKAVLGAAAFITGQGFFAQEAEASSLKCCDHTRQCSSNGCPSGYANTYTWKCGGHTYCHDCYNTTTHAYLCTYVTM